MYKKQRERSRDKQIFNKKEDIVRWEKENKTDRILKRESLEELREFN